MGIQGGPQSHEPMPHDAAHLDEDAECLEDPVHCGDAQHQHDVRAVEPLTPPAGETGQAG
jgi:hypothetical protein